VSRSSNGDGRQVWQARRVRYGYLATMRTKPGRRDELVKILLGGETGLREAGCDLYVVGTADTDPDTVWVFEVWRSKAHHAASLDLPETRAAIASALPLLTGERTGQELDIAGGLGIPA
jgi:quinol monooxygenase YgiN